jgi:hypothetical protein
MTYVDIGWEVQVAGVIVSFVYLGGGGLMIAMKYIFLQYSLIWVP